MTSRREASNQFKDRVESLGFRVEGLELSV